VVNAAGIFHSEMMMETSLEIWNQTLAVNLTGIFLVCRAAVPFLAKSGNGAIVNIASGVGLQPTGAGGAAYAASKAGIIAFSRSTAIAYVTQGIRVNTVVPGTMHTPLVEHRLAKQLGANDAAALIAKRHASVPMGRMGDAWDIAHAVLFLASDEARYITATSLIVDGGLTAARPG
jgi:NAD(P)-dependent dehydrogenase (short-subunit alcohol dehydrogenase family)